MIQKNHGRPIIMEKREGKPVHYIKMTDGKRTIDSVNNLSQIHFQPPVL